MQQRSCVRSTQPAPPPSDIQVTPRYGPLVSVQLVEREQRVTPLELFFDLVFVFGFTQVTTLLSGNPTWSGLGHALLILTALFNSWEDAVECARCGGRMVRTGSCYTCRDCGTNTGCS